MIGFWNKPLKHKTPQTYGLGSDRYAKEKEQQPCPFDWTLFVGIYLSIGIRKLVLDHTH